MITVRTIIEETVNYVTENSIYKNLYIKPRAKEYANIPQYKGKWFLYPSIDIRSSGVDTSFWFSPEAVSIFHNNKNLFSHALSKKFGKDRVFIRKRCGYAVIVKFDKLNNKELFINDCENIKNIHSLGEQFIDMMEVCDDLVSMLGVYRSQQELEEETERGVEQLNEEWTNEKQIEFLQKNIGHELPEQETVQIIRYKRNPAVVVAARWRADGHCEECKKPAPFKRQSDGKPFLEVHHIHPLSQGGVDKIDNVKAICPNCHRKLHYGIDQ